MLNTIVGAAAVLGGGLTVVALVVWFAMRTGRPQPPAAPVRPVERSQQLPAVRPARSLEERRALLDDMTSTPRHLTPRPGTATHRRPSAPPPRTSYPTRFGPMDDPTPTTTYYTGGFSSSGSDCSSSSSTSSSSSSSDSGSSSSSGGGDC